MFKYGGFKFFLIKISAGAVFLVFGMFMIISLGTYDTSDPGLGKLQSFGGTKNFFGYFGALASSSFLFAFGFYSFVLSFFFFYFGILFFLGIFVNRFFSKF